MKRKGQKGFTLIELTFAMFTGVIVIVAAGSILFYGQKSWNNTWKRVNLQRDASYAMQRMGRAVKAGISAQVEGSGKGLKIFNKGGSVRYFLSYGLLIDKAPALENNLSRWSFSAKTTPS